MDRFHRVRGGLSHVVPGGRMEDVLDECMRITIEVCERRMRGSNSARATGQAPSGGAVRPPDTEAASETSSTVEPARETKAASAAAVLPPAPAVDPATSSIVEPTHNRTGSTSEKRASRYLPGAVRSEVFERDEGCCTFVGANGRRCRSTYQLQFHHKVPFARGGPATSENLTLHCGRHNKHRAYADYGASHMDRFLAPPPTTPRDNPGQRDTC
jgi:5-methylcytosine-specific restriction endonuclease McrA